MAFQINKTKKIKSFPSISGLTFLYCSFGICRLLTSLLLFQHRSMNSWQDVGAELTPQDPGAGSGDSNTRGNSAWRREIESLEYFYKSTQ